MPVTTYMYAFGVRPERSADFAEWARTTGVPFWLSRDGLVSYRTYRVQAGRGASLGVVEFDTAEALGRMLDSTEWAKILGEFQSYVTELESWVLGPGATGEQPLRPAAGSQGGSSRA